jgi:hypothetical protein
MRAMRVVVRGLLGLAVLSALVSCRLDMTGLQDQDAGIIGVQTPGAGAAGTGAAGTGEAGTGAAGAGAGLAGQTGVVPSGSAGIGEAGTSGAAGTGEAGASAAGMGAAGTGEAGMGAAGTGEAGTGAAGTGAAGVGVAGMGAAGTGEAGMGAAGMGAAGMPPEPPPISKVGCADETREGFQSLTKYPGIAACSGAWQVPGLVAANTLTPQCQRRAGGDGAGCSVADLCAEGWHVCESVGEVKKHTTSCTDAFAPSGGTPVFFVTRQRGSGSGTVTCHPENAEDGTNNLYGCGNVGTMAHMSCQPFTRMLRDADCMNNAPWTCVDGPINYNVLELAGVRKPGQARGGVLCCR